MKQKMIHILFLLFITLLLTSCRNASEIENRYIVLGAAVDFDKDMYTITTEVVDYENSTAGKIVSKYYSGSGKSMFEAVRDIIKVSGNRLLWSHTKVVVVSNGIASKGMYHLIDYILRDQELRDEMKVIISREKTAKEIIECKKSKTDVVSNILHSALQDNISLPRYPDIAVSEFSYELTAPGIEPIAPAVKIASENGEKFLQMSGTAIFSNDKLVDFLGDMDSMWLLIVRNKLRSGAFSLKDSNTSLPANLALEVFNNSTKIKPRVENGKVVIQVEVKPVVGIAISDIQAKLINENALEVINSSFSKYLEDNMSNTIRKVQENYKVDIFGFGHKINTSLPSKWKYLKSDWNNNFTALNFTIKVDAEITQSGLITNPLDEE